MKLSAFREYHAHPFDRPVLKKLKEIGIGERDIKAAVAEIPTVNRDVATSFSKILAICAKYLTLSGAIWGEMENIPEAAMRFIDENYSSKIHIKDICSKLGCSKSTLLTSFKGEYGITVMEYAESKRMEHAEYLLLESSCSVKEIAFSSGFADVEYFSRCFKKRHGMPPGTWRRENASVPPREEP